MANCLPTPVPEWPNWRCAYRQSRAALESIPTDKLVELDIDIPIEAPAVLARLPKIMALRSRVASSLADFDMRAIDKLAQHLRAMCYAHWLFQSTRVSFERLQGWLGEWPTVQERLIAEARRQPTSDLRNRSALEHCANPGKFCQGLSNAQRLCCLVRPLPNEFDVTTGLRSHEIAHAQLLAELMAIIDVQGDDLHKLETTLRLNRQRAFTLFLLSYDQVRRATQFIRWSEGDADEIAPALHRQPIRRRPHRDPCVSAKYLIASAMSGVPHLGEKKTETAS
jgi:hypothetical protein